MNKKKHGGPRKGAGQPRKFDEKTVTVSARVPVSKADQVKQLIQELRAKWLK